METLSLSDNRARLESDPELWRYALFPTYHRNQAGATVEPASYHGELFDWIWALERGVRPDPLIAIWARGGAKSTNAEIGVVAIGALNRRSYGLYICDVQDRADDHVGNIGTMLESERLAGFYPSLTRRRVGLYGHSRGWRRNRLRAESGFTVDALGLDTAARGIKLDENRPGFLIFDDIDGLHDSFAATAKKEKTLTQSVLPAGSTDVAVLFVQNLVHEHSIASRLSGKAPEPAEYLLNRKVSGPHPAIRDLAYVKVGRQWRITQGTPAWAGFDLDDAEAELNAIGPTAFEGEYQHEVKARPGGMFNHLKWSEIRVPWGGWPGGPELGALERVVVWVDPAITKTDKSDSHAIQADGLGQDGKVYRLYSWEERATPVESIERALLKAHDLGAQGVGIETDQGGDTWQSVYVEALRNLEDTGRLPKDHILPTRLSDDHQAKAGTTREPKAHRVGTMLADYEIDRYRHVAGTCHVLEAALDRFPLTPPLDLADAAYWSGRDLFGYGEIAVADAEREMEPEEYDAAMTDAYTAERRSSWR